MARRAPKPPLQQERLELEDGDFLDLAWVLDASGPVVLLLHGLAGSVASPYARGFLTALARDGWRPVLMHHRGCSGEPNRLPQSYHAAHTRDLGAVVRHLRARDEAPIAVVGVSIGASCLLHWLAEDRRDLELAVAVSPPFDLSCAAERLNRGFSRLYQWHLLRALKRGLHAKAARGVTLPVALSELDGLRDFRRFDDRVTAPLHGFAGVDDYYRRASSRHVLRHIQDPTLILHALDDPFLDPKAVPDPEALSPAVTLELADKGGHVGFVSGPPWCPRYWLEYRITAALAGLRP